MFDFKNFDEELLIGCTYEHALKILEQLEEDCLNIAINNIDNVVELESYFYAIDFFIDSVQSKSFPDYDYTSPVAFAELGVFTTRLVSLKFNFAHYKSVKTLIRDNQNDVTATLDIINTLDDGIKASRTETSSKIYNISQKIDLFNCKMETYKRELEAQQINLQEQEKSTKDSLESIKKETKDSFQTQMKEIEHSTLTNVFTLLGVFSAIIVTIMSVVITTSSWLNKADGSDAMMAFVVPTAIVIVSVVVLLSFIHGLTNPNSFQKNNAAEVEDKNKIRNCLSNWFLITSRGTVALLILLIIVLAFLQNRNNKAIHIRQITIASECPTEEDEENGLMYIIVYDNYEYTFPCDKAILHNGELHFCTKHKRLE